MKSLYFLLGLALLSGCIHLPVQHPEGYFQTESEKQAEFGFTGSTNLVIFSDWDLHRITVNGDDHFVMKSEKFLFWKKPALVVPLEAGWNTVDDHIYPAKRMYAVNGNDYIVKLYGDNTLTKWFKASE